jgi:hypothetical protein
VAARKSGAAAGAVATVDVPRVVTGSSRLAVLGAKPLILNRMSEKARRELLLGGRRKTLVERQSTIKHDPYQEFRASPYTLRDEEAPTYLAVMSSAFKNAMTTAALDLPGANKSQIGRLVWVEGEYTPIYGVPKLFMSVVRSADLNRTPDIRTRAIVWPWAALIDVSYIVPLITPHAVVNLAIAGGQTVGIGDWRTEKGKATYGQFGIVEEGDPRLQAVLAEGRERQVRAMDEAAPYDQETEELLDWWRDDPRRLGIVAASLASEPDDSTDGAVDEAAEAEVR